MQRQAWYTWLASTNRPIFGQKEFKFKPFEELFSEPVPKQKTDPEQTKRICKAHGLNLIEDK